VSLHERQQAMARLHIARDNVRRAEAALAEAQRRVAEAEAVARLVTPQREAAA
jgi:hypothetical protein